jgi:hypothetical protein
MFESNNDNHLLGVGEWGQPLTLAARHAVSCAVICTSCADAGVAEVMDLPEDMRDGPDIADICEAMAWIATRPAGSSETVLRGMLEACAAACDQRAAFCDRYDHRHCRESAQISRDCARACRTALAAL